MNNFYLNDPVNNPVHYKGKSGLQAKDVIKSFCLGFNLGNAIKYILRCYKKNSAEEDLRKAIFYLNEEIDALLESKSINSESDK